MPKLRSLSDYQPRAARTSTRTTASSSASCLSSPHRCAIDAIPEHVVHAFLAARTPTSTATMARLLRHPARRHQDLRPGAHLQRREHHHAADRQDAHLGAERSLARKLREASCRTRSSRCSPRTRSCTSTSTRFTSARASTASEEAARAYFGKSIRDVDKARPLSSRPSQEPQPLHAASDPVAARSASATCSSRCSPRLGHRPTRSSRLSSKPVAPCRTPKYSGRPQYVDHVKKILIDSYGEDAVMKGGSRCTSA